MKQSKGVSENFNVIVPGVRVFLPPNENEAQRIQLSAGTERVQSRPEELSYVSEAIVPRREWRNLAPEECDLICLKHPSFAKGAWINVIEIPSAVLRPFDELKRDSRRCRTVLELRQRLRTTDCELGKAGLISYLRDCFAETPSLPIEGGVNVNAPNMPTTTTDPRTRLLVGLHLDSWYNQSVDSRHLSPNRACINLGCEDRFFLFLNVPFREMNDTVKSHCPTHSQSSSGTVTARAFMRLFPLCPVFRLRIRPGEGYLAPTENLAHDASSVGMSSLDVTFSVRGSFHPIER